MTAATATRRARLGGILAVISAAGVLAFAPSAGAAFGDNFSVKPINQPGAQAVPALPGYTHAFWAGACDRNAAPAPAPLPNPTGDIGDIGPTVSAPNGIDFVTFGGARLDVPAPATPAHCLDTGGLSEAEAVNLWLTPPAWRLPALAAAGAHPDGTASFGYNRDGTLDNIAVELPPGFVGNPKAVPVCTAEQFGARPPQCPASSQVGVLNLLITAAFGAGNLGIVTDDAIYPVYNLEPRHGNLAELGFPYASGERVVPVRIVAKARTNSDFGVTTFTGQIPAALPVSAQTITLWGVPWSSSNDVWRAPTGHAPGSPCSNQPGTAVGNYIPYGGFSPTCRVGYQPSWGEVKPFLSNETECNTGPTVRLATDAYQHPGGYVSDGSPAPDGLSLRNADPDPGDSDWKTYPSAQAAITDCEQVEFHPSITLDPIGQGGAASQATDSPTGLDVELSIPQNNDLPFNAPPNGAPQPDVDQYVADAAAYWKSGQGLATSHLEDTVVTLPEGMTLNPAAADGQGACTMAQMGVTDTGNPSPPAIRFNNAPIACPDSSKVGEVVIETPVLEEADWPTGEVYLATQGANPFGSDFAIYIGVRSPDRGLIAKLAGKVTPDPVTGRLTTTFVQNPELPFDTFRLSFKGGPRAPLATPVTCGTHTSVNSFTPYSDPGSPAVVNDPFQLTSSPAGGCPIDPSQRPLNLGFSAGSTELVAGSHSPFTVRLTRGDGNQELDRIEVTTPEGLAAKLAGVPYCPEAGIAQAISRTATGDGTKEQANPSCPASSQVGTTTIGAGAGRTPLYVGGKVYLAGPYKGAPVSMAFIVPAVAGPFDLGVQVVRTALNVNPKTAQVTAASDTIPKILRGIPLRIRDVRVDIDRPGFILNPTDCSEQLVTGRVFGASGGTTTVSNRFQIAECTRLGFKPNLSIRLFGGTKRGDYQRLRAVVTARPGDANIARAAVTLPHSEFLAQEHIRTVCTRVQFAADACPVAAIYGQATAVTPLLDQPLTGPVYLRSSDNPLPDLVAALKGPDNQPIEIELSGRTDSKNEGIRNTFDVVPDAPVSKFTLEMQGGKKSLIVNSTDICQEVHKATVLMDAQNGRKHSFRPKVVNPACGKAKKGKRGKKSKGHKRTVASRILANTVRGPF